MISCYRRLRRKIAFEWRLMYYTFCHNECADSNYILETSVEPMYRFADRFAKTLGPIFTFLVLALVSMVVGLFYAFILPYKLEHSSTAAITAYVVIGHWLLVNIIFHYVKGVITPPGEPPSTVPETVAICKRCISPKPPRTHHCSICKRCVLKMDHHCPWINNCVGQMNHRFFFLFMAYMWLGVVFVCVGSFDQFSYHAWGEEGILHVFPAVFGYLVKGEKIVIGHRNVTANEGDAVPMGVVPEITPEGARIKFSVFFEFILCLSVMVALGMLMGYHVLLISNGETTIEKHINAKQRKRLAKRNQVYRNPYHLGLWANWKLFLGLEQGRTFWRHVLLPSGHPPIESGLQWRTIYEPSAATKHL